MDSSVGMSTRAVRSTQKGLVDGVTEAVGIR